MMEKKEVFGKTKGKQLDVKFKRAGLFNKNRSDQQ